MNDLEKRECISIIKKANEIVKKNELPYEEAISLAEINSSIREFILFEQREKDLISPLLMTKIDEYVLNKKKLVEEKIKGAK